jgi:hypothetical protein
MKFGYMGKLKNAYEVIEREPQRGDHLEDLLGIVVRINTKAYLRENGMMVWNRFNLLGIRHNDGLSSDQLSSSTFQEIPCAMEYSSFFFIPQL